MYFNKVISSNRQPDTAHIISRRTAVRAIIMEKDKILMVRSSRGYFKLPGGGVEEGESRAEALVREVAEETGFMHCRIGTEIGTVSEQRPDQSSKDAWFHMNSHHFLCELSTKDQAAQSLSGYELEERYLPVWVSLQEAIDKNNSAYEMDKSLVFIPRENFVLEWVKQADSTLLISSN